MAKRSLCRHSGWPEPHARLASPQHQGVYARLRRAMGERCIGARGPSDPFSKEAICDCPALDGEGSTGGCASNIGFSDKVEI
jgi:hypothetical protein